MILDFLKKKGFPESFAVLDFTGSSVTAVIFSSTGYQTSGKLSVLGFGDEPFASQSLISGLILDLDQFRDSVKSALKKASFACGFNPSLVIPCLSAEFSKALSVKIKINRPSQEDSISDREWQVFERSIRENLLSTAVNEMLLITGDDEAQIALVEEMTFHARANGEEVLLPPLGRMATEITIDYLISFAQKASLSLIKKILSSLGKRDLLWTSRITNLTSLLSRSDDWLNAVFIDISNTSTDLSLVLNGSLIGVRTIPFGVSETGSIDPFSEVRNVNLPTEVKDWLSMVSLALSDFDGVKALPPTIIVYGRSSQNQLLNKSLAEFSWTKRLPFVDSPRVIPLLDLLDLSCFEDKTGRLSEFAVSAVAGQSFIRYVQNRS